MTTKEMPPLLADIYQRAGERFSERVASQLASAEGVGLDCLRLVLSDEVDQIRDIASLTAIVVETVKYRPRREMPDDANCAGRRWTYKPFNICQGIIYWILLLDMVLDEELLAPLTEQGYTIHLGNGRIIPPT